MSASRHVTIRMIPRRLIPIRLHGIRDTTSSASAAGPTPSRSR
jgi:hypothetical protein